MNFINKQFTIKNILTAGIILRIVFMIWGAPIYYGSADYATKGGDTHAWVVSMQNLVHTGTYTADPNYPDGKFFRPPGYPYFMIPFYFLSGFNLTIMYFILQLVQVLLDCLSIWLIYKIVKHVQGSNAVALVSALLYCLYPFAIVWSPFLYAESPSVFFLLLSIYLITKSPNGTNYLFSGLALGFAVLLRVQIIFAVFGFAFYLYKSAGTFKSLFFKPAILFFIAFGITYGSWPIRNLCYGKFIPAEELQNDKHFSADFIAYMFYIWSVKTDHNPQYEQIIHGQKVDWPEASYLHPEDSATLAHLAEQCNTCGRGFSHFKASAGLIKSPIIEDNQCTKDIATTFNRLREEQIRENSFHYYVVVPLSNLKKALFKISLYGEKSFIVKIVSTVLFSYRTIFIFLGLIGIWLNRKSKLVDSHFINFILIYFVLWYFTISFGYRNMEIRYFLMNDILLLIPASITLIHLARKLGFNINTSK
ncbi:MAG: glycosyltransferase family 39 protein [Bacteroidota bacterium]